ncbi:MAG: hypothetical protein IID31_08840 [Planctomycetes bacterium]|nr:hypothetical protein [Planctomycetota bacterium]
MRRILGIVAVCAVGSSAWGQQIFHAFGGYTGGGGVVDGAIVYDNSANTLGFLINTADFERGDGVTLAGTDRVVTNINVMIHVNGGAAGTADMQVRLFVGGDAGGGDPGALLWDSGLFAGVALSAGLAGYDFAVSNVTVPDEITWTVALSNVQTAGTTGVRFVAPPTVGSSEDWVWDHTGGVWTQQVFGVGAGNNSFGATITAIPTPGSLGLLAIGGIVMLRRRR